MGNVQTVIYCTGQVDNDLTNEATGIIAIRHSFHYTSTPLSNKARILNLERHHPHIVLFTRPRHEIRQCKIEAARMQGKAVQATFVGTGSFNKFIPKCLYQVVVVPEHHPFALPY